MSLTQGDARAAAELVWNGKDLRSWISVMVDRCVREVGAAWKIGVCSHSLRMLEERKSKMDKT